MSNVTKQGLGCIKATIIKDSISRGNRFTTFELEYPRFIHSELLTHCMLEKNAASSRAIPVEAMLATIENNPAAPIKWGANNPGMQSFTEMSKGNKSKAQKLWAAAAKGAAKYARKMGAKDGINAHKQIANRMSEPFQVMKTVISGTEWANFFWLRNHPDAQPEFQELARVMWECMEESKPMELVAGQWHLPYVEFDGDKYSVNGTEFDLEQAKKISASCCAQVQYRRLNDTIEQAEKVFGMLNLGSTDIPSHASPICHQGTPVQDTTAVGLPINIPGLPDTWEAGITHARRDSSLWSGKLRGWVQYRQLIPNEAKW